jgi:hypothetical protein
VSQFNTCQVCHNCDKCHICHKYHFHVPFDIKCVIGGYLVTHFNKVWRGWGGAKSDSKAFGGQLCCWPKAKICWTGFLNGRYILMYRFPLYCFQSPPADYLCITHYIKYTK